MRSGYVLKVGVHSCEEGGMSRGEGMSGELSLRCVCCSDFGDRRSVNFWHSILDPWPVS